MYIGRCHHKDRVVWRLLQRLEQRIESLSSEHMRFIKNVDFVCTGGRWNHNLFAQFADAVDAAIRCRIDLDDIEGIPGGNFAALLALVAGLAMLKVRAVDGFSEQARGRCLAGAAWTREEVSMPERVGMKRVLERINDRLLADHLVKGLRAPFAIERL